ncbi:MAG: carboxyl transferase domain-containing protein, partial [Dehalococcoidia bacterium]
TDRLTSEAIHFIEANARLQVEHTVTEEVMGVDLVQTQLRIAGGDSLADAGLADAGVARARGYAIQARVNMERITRDGDVRPAGGTFTAYDPPSGPGVRTDGFGYAGYRTSSSFDSLLAKVIGHSPSARFGDAVTTTARALSEFRIEGVDTNLRFLQAILHHPDFLEGRIYTRFVDDRMAELVEAADVERAQRYVATSTTAVDPDAQTSGLAGAQLDNRDPLALFQHDQRVKAEQAAQRSGETATELSGPDGSTGLPAPIQGTIVSVLINEGDTVHVGQQLLIMEAMKMEHVIKATVSGIVRAVTVSEGDVIVEGHPLVYLLEANVGEAAPHTEDRIDPDYIRPDLQETLARHAYTLDENRPEAVAKRRKRGYRMPRENIAQLVDPGSFKEYWPLIVARQHQRYDEETLRKNTPADGLVAGMCSINGDLFDDEHSRAAVISYDYTVLAGTQGGRNHYKQDRMFDLCNRFRLPLVFFTEGGGGRPGDDRTGPGVAFDTYTFTQFSKLSGLIPLVGVSNGRCFAGNTALLACCDVIIATEGSTIAMGGPAMIEGGGVGIYTPEEVGPMSFQVPNGVVDILVKDEEEAVDVAKKYLSYFQGRVEQWETNDQRSLRHVVPENRLRLYDMREIIHTLADRDSVLEIREKFGVGIITAFMRIEGRPMGVIANNPHHLAGAIDSDGADKCARFIQLCDAFDIPILSLMDCPGMMVGPDVERTALVRHCVRTFNAGANLTTPLFGVVVRKAYGLGVQAMCGASSRVGFFTVAWPTAEFAGMNIEGEVKLGFRNELAAIEDPEERIAEYERRVARRYASARAVHAAAGGGLDDVIDPAETREWIATSLRRLPPVPAREGKKYPYIDTW